MPSEAILNMPRNYFTTELTWSRNSGSEADASHLLLRTNIFGFESRVETLWKKFFS